MASDDRSSPAPPVSTWTTPLWARCLVFVAIAALLNFIVTSSRTIYREWSRLQEDTAQVRATTVVGYKNIALNMSFAQKPTDWYHHEGEFTLLWSGWKHGEGHRWFRVSRGDVDRARISMPIGRDVIQAIDHPLIEIGGGSTWERIPDVAAVAGQEIGGIWSVYPLVVLDKVEVVNDRIGDHAFLVAYSPFSRFDESVRVYDAVIDGKRVTMGLTGYLHDGEPMLYDRGTESLWVNEIDGLRAISGSHKGATLRRIGRPVPISWGGWRSRHPLSRLVVGADRSRPKPSL